MTEPTFKERMRPHYDSHGISGKKFVLISFLPVGVIVAAGVAYFALAGNDVKEKAQSVQPTPYFTLQESQKAQLEGKILGVQGSSINMYGTGGYGFEHAFEYVFVQGDDGKLRTLVYPHSKGIFNKEASITYHPLPNGIDSQNFVRAFINPKYETIDKFILEVDGVIEKQGIVYK